MGSGGGRASLHLRLLWSGAQHTAFPRTKAADWRLSAHSANASQHLQASSQRRRYPPPPPHQAPPCTMANFATAPASSPSAAASGGFCMV